MVYIVILIVLLTVLYKAYSLIKLILANKMRYQSKHGITLCYYSNFKNVIKLGHIYSTAKETRNLVAFKLFDYFKICSILEF